MFDFIAFLETHKLVDTVIVLLVIGLGVLVWREVSRWFEDRHHRDILSEEASNAVRRVEVALQEHVKMAANLCDGKNCANFEAIAKEVCQLRDVILRFEHDAKDSRNATTDAVQRIERNVHSLTNDLSVEILKFLRSERGK